MIQLDKLENNMFHIQIFEPRVQEDEQNFMNYLNHVVNQNSFSLAIEVSGDKKFSLEAKSHFVVGLVICHVRQGNFATTV